VCEGLPLVALVKLSKPTPTSNGENGRTDNPKSIRDAGSSFQFAAFEPEPDKVAPMLENT